MQAERARVSERSREELHKQPENKKVARTTDLLTITLNVNGLNVPTKR